MSGKQPKQPKHFKLELKNNSNLYNILKNTSPDLKLLAKELAEYTVKPCNNIVIHCNKDVIEYYHSALVREVFDTKESKFNNNFINGEGISDRAKKLREKFEDEALKLKGWDKEKASQFWEEIKGKELKLSKNFIKREEIERALPGFDIKEKDIEEFLENHLVFAVDQPNVDELSKLIQDQELKELLSAQNEFDYELIKLSIEKCIEDWKGKNKESQKEGWIRDAKRKEFIDALKEKIKASKVVGISWVYKANIENIINEYNVEFKKSVDGLDSFMENSEEQIFCINTEETLLSSIKVYQYLKNNPNYKGDMDNSHIFINLKLLFELKIPQLINFIVKAFEKQSLHNLLIIECEPVVTEQNIEKLDQLFDQLSEVIHNNSKKKIVLITSKNEEEILAKKFSEKYKNSSDFEKRKKYRELIEDKSINFTDLKDNSKILERKIEFQGEDTTLSKLLDKNFEVIDRKTLTSFIKGTEEITIGSKPLQLSDLEAAYSKLYEDIEVSSLVDDLLSEESNKLFMIGGINEKKLKEEFIKLNLENNKADKIKNQLILYNSDFADCKITSGKRIIIYEKKQNQEECFRNLSHRNKNKTIYWINWQKNKFVLQQLYNPEFYLDRKLNYQEKIIIKNNVKELFVKQDLLHYF